MAPRTALFIDAENLSANHAQSLLEAVRASGALAIARAYGDATQCAAWTMIPGVQFVHTRTGRNCADIALTIDAVDLYAQGLFDVAAIATSDSDFARLAEHLRARGATVLGFGERKAPQHLRQAFDGFTLFDPPLSILQRVVALLHENGGEMLISDVNPPMHRAGIQISNHPKKNWHAFLMGHEALFDCDPRGKLAKVRLRSGNKKGARPSPAEPPCAVPKRTDQFGISPTIP